MNFVLLSSIILALNILFIQFSRYKAESLFEIRVSIFKQLLKYWKPTSKFPLCVKGCKFYWNKACCAALYISTRKLLQRSINKILVGSSGLEPPTSRLSGVRSNHLSYEPIPWWRWTGSNRWPPACKAGALPAELHPRVVAFTLFSSFAFANLKN